MTWQQSLLGFDGSRIFSINAKREQTLTPLVAPRSEYDNTSIDRQLPLKMALSNSTLCD